MTWLFTNSPQCPFTGQIVGTLDEQFSPAIQYSTNQFKTQAQAEAKCWQDKANTMLSQLPDRQFKCELPDRMDRLNGQLQCPVECSGTPQPECFPDVYKDFECSCNIDPNTTGQWRCIPVSSNVCYCGGACPT